MSKKVDKDIQGIRHRVEYRKDPVYIVIFPRKCEVFISSVKQDLDPLTGAAMDAMSRLISMAWGLSTLDKVVDQLRKASRTLEGSRNRDLPGILADLLMEEGFVDDICDSETN